VNPFVGMALCWKPKAGRGNWRPFAINRKLISHEDFRLRQLRRGSSAADAAAQVSILRTTADWAVP
jgi:hypothetical protein